MPGEYFPMGGIAAASADGDFFIANSFSATADLDPNETAALVTAISPWRDGSVV